MTSTTQRSRYWILKLKAYGSSPTFEHLPYQEAIYRRAFYIEDENEILYLLKLPASQRSSYFKTADLLSATPCSQEDILDIDNYTDIFLGESGSLDNGSTLHDNQPQDRSSDRQQHIHIDPTNKPSPKEESTISTDFEKDYNLYTRLKRQRTELDDELGRVTKRLKPSIEILRELLKDIESID